MVDVGHAPAPKAPGLAEVLVAAVGFTGVLLIGAALFGLALGALFIAYHRLRPGNRFNGETAAQTRLNI